MTVEQTCISWEDFEASCLSVSKIKPHEIDFYRTIYIFGSGRFGQDLASAFLNKGYRISGFIETSPQVEICKALRVYSWAELPIALTRPLIVIGIYNRDMPFDDLLRQVRAAGYSDVLLPWDCYEILSDELGWRYWLMGRYFLLNHIPKLKKTYDMLSDKTSKSVFLRLCLFRLGLDDSFSSYRDLDKQYFNSLTLSGFSAVDKLNYVDCGAYNGDTYFELCQIHDVGDSYLFEPDPENYRDLVAEIRASDFSPTLLPLALSKRRRTLSFNASGEGGSVSDHGNIRIEAVSLDEVLNNKIIHFIKFDVEGSEIDAIIGAQQLIKTNRPVLAISLYHRPNDLWEIPELLSTTCLNYSFYIRQHFYNSFDCVIYAIPN